MEHHAQAPLMRHALAEHEHAAFVKICVIRGKTKPASPRMGPTLVARGETPRNQIENTHSPRMGPAYQRVLTSLHSTPILRRPLRGECFCLGKPFSGLLRSRASPLRWEFYVWGGTRGAMFTIRLCPYRIREDLCYSRQN